MWEYVIYVYIHHDPPPVICSVVTEVDVEVLQPPAQEVFALITVWTQSQDIYNLCTKGLLWIDIIMDP